MRGVENDCNLREGRVVKVKKRRELVMQLTAKGESTRMV